MADNTIKINIDVDDKPIKSLKAELRETVQQLQQTELGTEAFDRLNKKASELKDKMNEVNEQVAVFATGSKYEQVSNSLGEIGQGIRDMDFDRVTQGAKLFAQTSKSITFKDAIGSLKQMGSAFVSIGKSILTNPLFLIVAVVGAIIGAIVALLDELGVLKVIFKAVGDAIGWVIKQLKDFLDWLGLTDYAAEESARKQASAQEKIAQGHEAKRAKVTDAYDHEIRLAKIAGEDTVNAERQKQYAIIQTSQAQYQALQNQMASLKASGDLTKEKADEIRKAMLDLKGGIREARQEIEAINAQDVADNKAKNEKKAADNKAADKAAEDRRKQDKADRLAASRTIQDAELELMTEGIEKELKVNEYKYIRLIEDTLNNEKLLASERTKLAETLKLQELANIEAINKKHNDAELEQKAIHDGQLAELQKQYYEYIDSLNPEGDEALRMEKLDAEIVQLEEFLKNKTITQEQYAQLEKDAIAKAEEDIKIIQDAAREERKKKDDEEAQERIDRAISTGNAMADVTKSGLQGISDLVAAFAGKSLAAQKRAFETQKKLNIVMATIDTIKGAVSAFTGMITTVPGPVGLALGAVAAAGVVASGVANVKKISSTQFNGGGGGGAGASTGAGVGGGASFGGAQTQPTPQMNLNNGVEQNAGGKARERVIVVDYHDIAEKGNNLQNNQQKVTLA